MSRGHSITQLPITNYQCSVSDRRCILATAGGPGMSSLVCASLALLVTVFQQAPASARPDFSGTWTLDRSRSQSPEAITLTIKQTATEVSIETTRDGTKSVRTYPIEPEGKPSSGIDSSHPRAYWNGTKLVAEGAGNIQGQTVSTRETHSLNAAATEM